MFPVPVLRVCSVEERIRLVGKHADNVAEPNAGFCARPQRALSILNIMTAHW